MTSNKLAVILAATILATASSSAFAVCESISYRVVLEYKSGALVSASSEQKFDNLVEDYRQAGLPAPAVHAQRAMQAVGQLQSNPYISRSQALSASGESPENTQVQELTVWCSGFSPTGQPGFSLRKDAAARRWASATTEEAFK